MWDAADDGSWLGFLTINQDGLRTIGEKGLDPFQRRSSDSIMVQLAEEAFVGDFVEGLGEVKYDHICLLSAVMAFGDVVEKG